MSDQTYPKGRTPFTTDEGEPGAVSPCGNKVRPEPPLDIIDHDKIKTKTIVK